MQMKSDHQNKAPAQSGFTLIELMVVVSISAILLAIAVPSFQSLIKKSNVDSRQSALSSGLSVARTEAASRNRTVSICASDDSASCTGADWSDGWIIFEDTDGDGAVDAADVLIDVLSTGAPAYTVTATPPAATFITFNSQGFIRTGGLATLLTICEPDKNVTYARALYVNLSGLVMKSRDGTDTDLIHDNPIPSTVTPPPTDPLDLACP